MYTKTNITTGNDIDLRKRMGLENHFKGLSTPATQPLEKQEAFGWGGHSKKESVPNRSTGVTNYTPAAGGGSGGASNALMTSSNSLMAHANIDEEAEAQRAGERIQHQVDNALEAHERNQTRMGINPNSARFEGTQKEAALQGAAAKAAGMNEARADANAEEFNRMATATQMKNSALSSAGNLSLNEGQLHLAGSKFADYQNDRSQTEAGIRDGLKKQHSQPSIPSAPVVSNNAAPAAAPAPAASWGSAFSRRNPLFNPANYAK